MEFLLSHNNLFYLYGIIFLIRCIVYVNKQIDYTKLHSRILMSIETIWIIIGMFNFDSRNLFLALCLNYGLVQILFSLLNPSDLSKKRFNTINQIINCLILICILINHFKFDIFYLTL